MTALNNEQASQRFDNVIAKLDGLPGVRKTRPTTVRSIVPILNEASTVIVQTFRVEDGGFVLFIESMDGSGHTRLVLTDKVAQALYRQRQSLTDRSTPESRARKAASRERARKRQEREERRAAWAARQAAGGK